MQTEDTPKSMPKPKQNLSESDRQLAEQKWRGIVELDRAMASKPNNSPQHGSMRKESGVLLEEWQDFTGCKKIRRSG